MESHLPFSKEEARKCEREVRYGHPMTTIRSDIRLEREGGSGAQVLESYIVDFYNWNVSALVLQLVCEEDLSLQASLSCLYCCCARRRRSSLT